MKRIASLLLCGLFFIESSAQGETFKQASSEVLPSVIIAGTTTQDELKSQLGTPDNKELKQGKETWVYKDVSFTNLEHVALKIEFNASTFVEGFSLEEA